MLLFCARQNVVRKCPGSIVASQASQCFQQRYVCQEWIPTIGCRAGDLQGVFEIRKCLLVHVRFPQPDPKRGEVPNLGARVAGFRGCNERGTNVLARRCEITLKESRYAELSQG